jgi:hypothetical protein
MHVRSRVVVVAVLAMLASFIGGAPRVFAQSASVQAQSLFDEGRRLIKAGKIAEACVAFESSQKLDPAITTLLNLAECREQNRQLATAWGTFIEANRVARGSKNAKLARVATNHARKLEPRLSRLTIAVPTDRQVAGLEILRDSDPVNPASWNHALPIDGGTYTITARAPGRTPWSTTRTITIESDAQVVEVPKLAEDKPAPVAARPRSPSRPPAPAAGAPGASSPGKSDASSVVPVRSGGAAVAVGATASQPEGRGSRRWPLAFGAGALALGGTALVFKLWGDSTYDEAKDEVDDQSRRDSLYHSANNRQYVAEALAVAAVGCAGAAVYFYFFRDRRRGRADTTAMTPIAAPQFAGLAVTGSW